MRLLKLSVLYAGKYVGLFALFRRLTRKLPRILCYHGGSMADEHLFHPKLFCHADLLEQRLRWLQRKGFVPGDLDTLLSGKGADPAGGTPVVVTLDDGWVSSGNQLIPLLGRYRYPSVLYLTTKLSTEGGPVTDVCVNYIVWKAQRDSVQLSGFGPELDGSYGGDGSERSRLRKAAERWLAQYEGQPQARVAALQRFASALGVPPETLDLESRRFSLMQGEELLEMKKHNGHIELHGHAHLYVPGDQARNRSDIEVCRERIRDIGLPEPQHYCYPSGEFDPEAAATMRAAGVASATTCQPGLVRNVAGDSRYFLPRFLDGGDVAMIEFEAEMSGVLDFVRKLRGRAAT
jgi:peptidoglycan/xylan/chitin deacetylase (PgdA/CDA1 family)